jgi:Immunity protein Imm5
MKKEFTPNEIMTGIGCYSKEQIEHLSFIKQNNISIIDILNSEIPLKDKRWFLWNKCDINLQDKKELALKIAWCVLPIYQAKYPNDTRVEDCLKAIKDFYDGNITIDELKAKRSTYAADAAAAAYAAVDAADAAYAAAYAAYAAAYAAANAAANAADAAAYAANAADARPTRINLANLANQAVSEE